MSDRRMFIYVVLVSALLLITQLTAVTPCAGSAQRGYETRATGKDVALIPPSNETTIEINGGGSMRLVVNATNVGTVTVNFNVTLTIFNVTAGIEEYNQTNPVSSLAPGDSALVDFGEHTSPTLNGVVLKLKAYANLTGDDNLTNNVLEYTFIVNNSRDGALVDYAPNSTYYGGGEIVKFSALAANYGVQNLTAELSVVVRNETGSDVFTATSGLTTLARDESKWIEVTTNWAVPVDEMNYTVFMTLVVDNDDRPENNNISFNIIVTVFEDVSVINVEATYWNDPVRPIPPGEEIYIKMLVGNNGTVDINNALASVTVWNSAGEQVFTYISPFDISVGSTFYLSMGVFTPEEEDTYRVEGAVSYSEDSDPSNNIYNTSFTVAYLHDFSISNPRITPTNITVGDSVVIRADVSNNGNSMDDFLLEARIYLGSDEVFYYNYTETLNIGARTTVTVAGFIPQKSGTYELYLNLTVPGDTGEDNSIHMYINVSRMVDLEMMAVGYPIEGQTYMTGEVDHIEVTVRNNGDETESGTLNISLYGLLEKNRITVLQMTDFSGDNLSGILNTSTGSLVYKSDNSSSTVTYTVDLPSFYDRTTMKMKYSSDVDIAVRGDEKELSAPEMLSSEEVEFNLGGTSSITLEFSGAGEAVISSIIVMAINETPVYNLTEDITLSPDAQVTYEANISLVDVGEYRLVAAVNNPEDLFPGNNILSVEFTVTSTASINHPPVAIISYPISGSVVSVGEAITLSANGSYDPDGDAITYTWIVDGEEVGTGMTIIHAFMDVGPAGITLTVSDGEYSSSASITIVVQKPEDIERHSVYTDGDTIIHYAYQGDEVVLSYRDTNITDIGGKPVVKSFEITSSGDGTLLWLNAVINISDGNTTGKDLSKASLYYKDVITGLWNVVPGAKVTGGELQFNFTQATEFVLSAPLITVIEIQPVITISGSGKHYVGEMVEFSAAKSQPIEEITAFYWDFDGDGKIDARGSAWSHRYEKPGEYTVVLIVQDSNGDNHTTSKTLVIYAQEEPPISSEQLMGISAAIIILGLLLVVLLLRRRSREDEEELEEWGDIEEEEEESGGEDEVEKVRRSIQEKKQKVKTTAKETAGRKTEVKETPARQISAEKVEPTKPTEQGTTPKVPVKVPIKAKAKVRAKALPQEEKQELPATTTPDETEEEESEGDEVGDKEVQEEAVEEPQGGGWHDLPEEFPFGCPKCGNDIMIPTSPDAYPRKVVCPKCGAKGNLKTLPVAILRNWLDEEGVDYDEEIFDDL